MPSEERPFIRVPAEKGETVRKMLLEGGLLDTAYRIWSEGGTLYLPITTADFDSVLTLIGPDGVETGLRGFEPIQLNPRKLGEILGDVLTKEELELLPRA